MSQTFEELTEIARDTPEAFRAVSRAACLQATTEYVNRMRMDIRTRHVEGGSGDTITRALSNTADTIIRGVVDFGLATLTERRSLVKRRSLKSQLSLCAFGGYGRGTLSPHSDLDVNLLYDGKLDDRVQELNKYIVPFLWDLGFSTSYCVRSVKESIALAREDRKVFTSFLEGRIIYGDNTPFARLKLSIREVIVKDRKHSFTLLKLRERGELLSDEYSDLYAPEPNVKENAGGLRDYHTALWLLCIKYEVSTLRDAFTLGHLTEEEFLTFSEGLDFVQRVRNELHFHCGKAQDRLTYANQKHLTVAFGYGEPTEQNVARLMQDYYNAARKLRRFLRVAARVCNAQPEDVLLATPRQQRQESVIEEGELYVGIDDPHWFQESPPRLMGVFCECARKDLHISHETERLVRDNVSLINDSFRANALVRSFFMAIVSRPLSAGTVLRQAAATGVLGAYIPEFADVSGVLRYEDFHSYPVDEHTLQAIDALAGIPCAQGM